MRQKGGPSEGNIMAKETRKRKPDSNLKEKGENKA